MAGGSLGGVLATQTNRELVLGRAGKAAGNVLHGVAVRPLRCHGVARTWPEARRRLSGCWPKAVVSRTFGGVWAAQTPVHDLVSESVGPHSLGQQLRPAPQTSPWVANTETKFYAFGKRNLPGFLASNTTELRRPAHAFR